MSLIRVVWASEHGFAVIMCVSASQNILQPQGNSLPRGGIFDIWITSSQAEQQQF